jgi:heme/copper-type cytochrome/quinol oxidase subunit 2
MPINPASGIAKFSLTGMAGFGYWSLLATSASVYLRSLAEGHTMIFENIPNWVLYLGVVTGALILVLVKYFYEYEDKRKHSEQIIKWDHTYTIAIFLTVICAIVAAYLICIYGLDYIYGGNPIAQPGLAFLICFAISAVSAYFFDAFFPKYLADGTLAKIYADGQELIRERAASEEAQKALFNAFSEKIGALVNYDDAKIKMVMAMCNNDSSSPLVGIYAQMAAQVQTSTASQ